MARLKRSSRVLDKAERRLAGIKSIDPNLNLGGGLTVEAYSKLINQTRQSIANYNTLLSKVDEASNKVEELERLLSRLSENMLASIAIKYGRNSSEYEMAGGKPRGRKGSSSHTPKVEATVIEADIQPLNGKQAIIN